MKLTADIIYGFTNSLLMPNFDNPRPTPDFHLTLWELMCSEEKKVAVAAPRGHAKSTAVTHSYVLANVCFRIKRHILIVSDTEGQAVDFLRDIKIELTENQELMSLFDITGLIKDRESECVVEFKGGEQTRILVKGSEQKVRGLKWRNKRPDLIVGDDLENDEIVMNEDRRYKFMRWFYGALLPCGGDDTHIRIVGTILHMDSMLENLMPNALDKETIITPLSTYSTNTKKPWKSIKFKAHDEEFDNILWSERFDAKYFKDIRQDYIDRGFPEGYSQEYLNHPLDEENAYFKGPDFIPLTEPQGIEEFYVAADLAISQKKERAYTVLTVASVDSRNRMRFRDVVRFRGDALEIIDNLFRLQNMYNPVCFFIEQENIARSLGAVLDREMEERGVFLSIEKMQATQDKIKRARALQARMRAGMVEFDTDAEWYPSFQQELLQFPRGKYMDQVDSASWIALGLNKISEAPTKKEFEQERYEKEIEESFDNFGFGQNSITGY